MNYDFDTVWDRKGTYSLKWDVEENELPMWVADMDFKAAPEILEALEKRLKNGIFGYTIIPEEWEEAYRTWWDKRHDLSIPKGSLVFCTGVIPALSTAVRTFTRLAEKVLLQTPVYNIFFNSIVNNGRKILENPLIYENGSYRIDWEDLENKLSDPQTAMFILCNPHNPIGRIWDRDTLERMGELCKKHDVLVFADEIHCDLTEPGHSYIPFASVSDTCREISLTALAPTKAFNLAGIQTAAVFSHNKKLRQRIWRGLNTDEVAEPNAFAIDAAIAAFTRSGEWLDALREYISENRRLATESIRRDAPELSVVPQDATYLLWIDGTALPKKGKDFAGYLRKETGLFVTDGIYYGSSGEGFLRMNLACPRELLRDGLKRLSEGLRKYRALNETRE